MAESIILIVDDDDDDRFIIGEAFEKVGENVKLELFSNGAKAIHHLLTVPKEKLPCLVVLDYNMPAMNGREVVEVICKTEKLKEVPAIIFTTSNSPILKQECLESGAIAFKTKPTDFSSLLEATREMLELCKVAISK